MDFYKEFADIKQLWITRSIYGKVFLVIATLFSMMSFGSLADTVFSFKGFIVEGFVFYREVTEPIRLFISDLIGYEVSQKTQDIVTASLLGGGVALRIKRPVDGVELREGLEFWLFLFFMTGFALLLGAPIALLRVEYELSAGLSMLIILPLTPYLSAFTKKIPRVESVDHLRAIYFLSIYFVIACLAAIGEGLTRVVV